MRGRRWLVGLVALVLIAVSVWQILVVGQGLEVVRLRSAAPPLTLVRPRDAEPGSRPLVLIAHGIAGSGVIMRGFAYTLAHAGYAVALWDFRGHGANPHPFPTDRDSNALQEDAEAALAEATALGWGDPVRLAIIGHSMGSGVALAFGQERPGTAATIAVSPTGQAVTPELPKNLLLMAGSLEGQFVRNAEERLAEAGGPGGDPSVGTGRKMVVIPGVEHISILFSPRAHAAARDWLDATFGPQPGAEAHTDRRVAWYGLGLLGTLVAAVAFAPLVGESLPLAAGSSRRPLWWRLVALLGGGVLATIVLWVTGLAGLELNSLLGMVVGGYLLVWFAVAGLATLFLLRHWPSRPTLRTLWAGLAAFLALWLGVGLLGQLVWLPWLLIPRRLVLWPLGVVLALPWFLAAGQVSERASMSGRLGWWLAHSAAVTGCAFLALLLRPELGFLILILPLFPAILGFHAVVAGPLRRSWSFAVSGALFTSWLVLAVFPLL